MAIHHKGSPPSDASSAPESGTVRDERDNKAPEQQQKFPKRRPGQNNQRREAKSRNDRS